MMASSCTYVRMADSLRELVTDLNATNDISLEAAEGYSTRIELLYKELLATELEQGQLVDGQLEVLTNLAKAYEKADPKSHSHWTAYLQKIADSHA